MILDKLVYNKQYKDTDEVMSNSNIGARKGRDIKNHLFIVYGILNSVINGKMDPVDIEIFDLIKCFDTLWLDDCFNDLFDTLPDDNKNDKIALLYKSNVENFDIESDWNCFKSKSKDTSKSLVKTKAQNMH